MTNPDAFGINRSVVDLTWAITLTVLFYLTYALALVLSLAIPIFVFFPLGRAIDWVIGHVLHDDFGSFLTVCAVALAEISILSVFAKTLLYTFLAPGALVVAAVSETPLPTAEQGVEVAHRALSDFVTQVTNAVGGQAFNDVLIEAGPQMASRKHTLVVGWPLLRNLTQAELGALIAHECAHSHRQTAFAARSIWGLSALVRRHSSSTQRSLDRIRTKARSGPISYLAEPMVQCALGLAALFLRLPQRFLERRLGKGNYPVELYCDHVGAVQFGGNVMSIALDKVASLAVAFEHFLRDSDTTLETNNIYPTFDAYYAHVRPRLTQSDMAERYWNDGDRHPSLKSRFAALASLPPRQDSGAPALCAETLSGCAESERMLTGVLVKSLERWRTTLREGLHHLSARRIAAAGLPLSLAAEMRPDDGESLGWLGVYHARMKRLDEAYKCLLRARRHSKDRDWVGNFDFVVCFAEAAHKVGGRPAVWLANAARQLQRGDLNDALDAIETVEILDAKYTGDLLIAKGIALEGLGRLDDACSCFEREYQKDPTSTSSRTRLAAVLLQQVEYLIWKGGSVPDDPRSVVSYEARASLSPVDNDKLTRVLCLTNSGQAGPGRRTESMLIRAAATRLLGRYAEAATIYREVLDNEPQNTIIQEYHEACISQSQARTYDRTIPKDTR
jgi:tetratricopeptide (TPR) repeat protein